MPTATDLDCASCASWVRIFKRPYELPTHLSYREQVQWLQEEVDMWRSTTDCWHGAFERVSEKYERIPRIIRWFFS